MAATTTSSIDSTRTSTATKPGKAALWTGRIMTAVPSLLMLMSASMKLQQTPQVLEGWAKGGFPASTLVPVGLIEVFVVVVYLIPRTAVLGAILVSGYLSGAFLTHLRALEIAGALPVLLGMMAWGGLWFREPRLRELLPLRR